jgi:hypothetical protein
MSSGIVLQLIGTAGSVAALLWGVWAYMRNAEAHIQSLALERLQHYLDLAVKHPDSYLRVGRVRV